MLNKNLVIPFRAASGDVVWIDLTPVCGEGNLFRCRNSSYCAGDFGFETAIECLDNAIMDLEHLGYDIAWEEYD